MYGPSKGEMIGFVVVLVLIGTGLGSGLSYVARHLVVDVDERWEAP